MTDIEKSPEAVARVKNMLDAFNARCEEAKAKTPTQIASDMAMIEKMETRVPGEFVEYNGRKVSSALIKNLGVHFTVGDPDGDKDVS